MKCKHMFMRCEERPVDGGKTKVRIYRCSKCGKVEYRFLGKRGY